MIYIRVPESSQVHSTAGKIFDRNDDGDFDITSQHSQVAELYRRKQNTYSENTNGEVTAEGTAEVTAEDDY